MKAMTSRLPLSAEQLEKLERWARTCQYVGATMEAVEPADILLLIDAARAVSELRNTVRRVRNAAERIGETIRHHFPGGLPPTKTKMVKDEAQGIVIICNGWSS